MPELLREVEHEFLTPGSQGGDPPDTLEGGEEATFTGVTIEIDGDYICVRAASGFEFTLITHPRTTTGRGAIALRQGCRVRRAEPGRDSGICGGGGERDAEFVGLDA